MKELIKKEIVSLLKLFRQKYGNDTLDNVQLNRIGKEYLGKKFVGVFPYDRYPNKNGFAIINTDNSHQQGTHWMMIYKVNNILYIYDSFGRRSKHLIKEFFKNHIDRGYQIIDIDLKSDQGNYQQDCGLRSFITALMINKYGVKEVMDY